MSNESVPVIDTKKRSIIMAGLAIALFAACFDGTVTSSCGPTIARQFNASDLLPWLTTGYLLMETVTIPLSGKLSDLYGRKKLLIIGLVLFVVASFVAGVAPNMYACIAARALQGAGGGILIPVATAAVSDLYLPEERGKIQGLLGALFGVGMGAGPFIGGFFASMNPLFGIEGWHFAFLINIPIVLVVIAMTRHEFPTVVAEGKPRIDYLGAAAISAMLILVVFYFQLLGKSFDIISIPSFVFLLVIVGVYNVFHHIEKNAAEPIIAPNVFKNPTVKSAAILLFILGFSLVGDELFMGMYLQRICGFSAMESGVFILIMVIGMILTSTIGGALLYRTGIKPWVVAGPILMAIGFFLFSYIESDFDMSLFCVSELLFGMGGGCILASLMTAVQNSCGHSEVGMTTSAVNLMRNIGSTVGTSVLTLIVSGVIYGEALDSTLPSPFKEEMANAGIGILDHIGLYPMLDPILKNIFTDSVGTAFGFVALMLVIASIIGVKFKIASVEQTARVSQYEDDLTKDNKKI